MPKPIIRAQPEDFLVEEVSEFEPKGSGDHLALWVRKRGLDHRTMVSRIAEAFRVKPSAIGWAGMKDRAAVTLQWVTVKTDQDRAASLIDSDELCVLHASRHPRRLRLGHLTGNRFIIRVRHLDPTRAPSLHRRMQTLQQLGLPNRFGSQRFGHRGANSVLGARLLQGQYEDLLSAWLGQGGPDWPGGESNRRGLFEQRDFARARAEGPASWGPERRTLQRLSAGESAASVIEALPRSLRRLWTDSAQSLIFNEVLARRLTTDGAVPPLEGDITWSHDRLLESCGGSGPGVSPTGPMWGRRMRRAGARADELEIASIEAIGCTLETMVGDRAPAGTRRPLLVPVINPHASSGFDGDGPFVELTFTLAKGCYATTLLGEIIDLAST